jgi:diaminopimelate decarboxylase
MGSVEVLTDEAVAGERRHQQTGFERFEQQCHGSDIITHQEDGGLPFRAAISENVQPAYTSGLDFLRNIGNEAMDYFNYKNGELYCEDVPAKKIADEVGTACYVYSKATLLHHYRQIAEAFRPLNATICFSIKSLGNINICRILANEGCGFDVTSGGELYRALQAGGDPKKMIYAGVGKTDQEIIDAINAGIAAFNLESEAEIENIDRVAASIGKNAVGAIRINPDVDPGAKTHAKTTTGKKETKFGVDIERAERVFEQYRNLKNLRIGGIHIHIGSPIYDVQPYVDAV